MNNAMTQAKRLAVGLALFSSMAGCRQTSMDHSLAKEATVRSGPIQSLIPSDRLAKIKSSLPDVAYPALKQIFQDDQTLWYDHTVMKKSYQDSYGAQTNTNWPKQIAPGAQSAVDGLYDRQKRRWKFPFSTTAGTDESTNTEIINFLSLPKVNGKALPIPIWTVTRNYDRPSWMWMYPNGTMLGEIIFIVDGDTLLPSEVRIRHRHAAGWASNVYRPFTNAQRLSAEVKKRRSDWQNRPNLVKLVNHLDDPETLTAKRLQASSGFRGTFDQSGALDVLPDFEDPGLVRDLLTKTPFVSSYSQVWKESTSNRTFAASTKSGLSIVPINYDAGMIEVNDTSCMRCHQDAGRLVSDFASSLYLYGEVWGKDNIFTFHVMDESQFQFNRFEGRGDIRRMNPRLVDMGVIEKFDASKHVGPHYRPRND